MYLDEPGVATLTVVRDGPLDVVVTVNYMTRDGDAVAADGDYVAIAPTLLTFGIGEQEKQITVTVLGDDVPEPNEAIYVDLFDPTGMAYLNFFLVLDRVWSYCILMVICALSVWSALPCPGQLSLCNQV